MDYDPPVMDPRSPAPVLFAPGAAHHGVQAPSHPPSTQDGSGEHRRAHLPAIDDHLLAEDSHAEILDGQLKLLAMGSHQPHATRHIDLATVVRTSVRKGYESALDLLTRTGHKDEFAPDISVYPTGDDPVTGGRRVDELVIEVMDSTTLGELTAKATKLTERGVRRVLAVDVNRQTVHEWSGAETRWREVDAGGQIEDPCFVTPLPVRAFVDALLVDEVVLQALRAKRTPALLEMLDDSQKRGRDQGLRDGRDQGLRDGRVTGLREAIRATLRARGMSLTDDQRARVEACDDPDALTAWLVRAATVGRADDVLG